MMTLLASAVMASAVAACQSETEPTLTAVSATVAVTAEDAAGISKLIVSATATETPVALNPSPAAERIVTVAPEVAERLTQPETEVAESLSRDEEEQSDSALASTDTQSDVDIVATLATDDGTTVHDGGVLRVPFNGGLIPDPAFDDGIDANRPLLAEIFSGLTRLSPSEGLAELDLAESFSIASDGMAYEFVLRKELRFSDGSPVNAADFKWSWERALDPTYSNRNAQRVFDGVTDFVVIDDLTLRINLERPKYDFLHLLADPIASVLNRENVENWVMDWRYVLSGVSIDADHEFGDQLPVGTGPFKLVEYDLFNHVLVLERNEHHWDVAANVDRIEFISPGAYSNTETLTDPGTLFENYVIDLRPIPPDFSDIEGEWKTRSFDVPPTVDFLAFNSDAEWLSDADFRHALVNASPVHELISEEGISINGSEIATAISLLPPNFPGYSSEYEDHEGSYGDGPSMDGANPVLTFHTYVGGEAIAEFEILSSAWREQLGVETNVREVSLDKFDAWLKNGDVEIMRVRVTPHFADPSAILNVMYGLFGERDESLEAREIKRRLDEANQQADEAVRLAHYHDLEHYLLDNALVLPLFWTQDKQWLRVQPWIVEYAPPKYHGSRFKTLRIDVNHPDYPYDER